MGKKRYRPEHQRMLNDRRWKETKRIVWERAGGLCEQCREDGRAAGVLPDGWITPGVDCHHIIPFESAKTIQECERLCYDPNNVKLVCIPCHVKIHKAMGKNTRANVQARREQRMERWKEYVSNLHKEKPTEQPERNEQI